MFIIAILVLELVLAILFLVGLELVSWIRWEVQMVEKEIHWAFNNIENWLTSWSWKHIPQDEIWFDPRD